MDDAVTRYVLQGSDAGGWSIARTGVLAMPSRFYGLAGGATHLVGMTALADGTVVACSKEGDVMAVRVDASGGFVLRYVRIEARQSAISQTRLAMLSTAVWRRLGTAGCELMPDRGGAEWADERCRVLAGWRCWFCGCCLFRDVLRLADSGVGQGEAIHVSNSISSEGQQVKATSCQLS